MRGSPTSHNLKSPEHVLRVCFFVSKHPASPIDLFVCRSVSWPSGCRHGSSPSCWKVSICVWGGGQIEPALLVGLEVLNMLTRPVEDLRISQREVLVVGGFQHLAQVKFHTMSEERYLAQRLLHFLKTAALSALRRRDLQKLLGTDLGPQGSAPVDTRRAHSPEG